MKRLVLLMPKVRARWYQRLGYLYVNHSFETVLKRLRSKDPFIAVESHTEDFNGDWIDSQYRISKTYNNPKAILSKYFAEFL